MLMWWNLGIHFSWASSILSPPPNVKSTLYFVAMVGIGLSHLFSPLVASHPDMTPSSKPDFGYFPQDTVSVHLFSLISSHSISNPHAQATWISSEVPPSALSQSWFFCRSAQLWPIFTCLILLIFETHFNSHSQALWWSSYHSCLFLCTCASHLQKTQPALTFYDACLSSLLESTLFFCMYPAKAKQLKHHQNYIKNCYFKENNQMPRAVEGIEHAPWWALCPVWGNWVPLPQLNGELEVDRMLRSCTVSALGYPYVHSLDQENS